jgi:sugar phosphate isomerase/epimerase
MKLGVVADEISRDFRESVRIGKRLGIERYEVRFLRSGRAPMCDQSEMLEVERIRDDEGIEITALSPGLFKYTSKAEEFKREMLEVLPRAVEWALRLRLPALIIFGFLKQGATEANGDLISSANPPAYVSDWLAEAASRASSAGLKLLIEAEPICWADTGIATVELIRRAQSDALGINYDPANIAWQYRRDPLDEFDVVSPYIGNVHIKDLIGAPLGSGIPTWAIPGRGMIDYAAHFARLKALKYSGPVSLEPHLDSDPETIQKCKEAVESLWMENEVAR